MPGWKDDMDFDEIEGYAQHTVNNDGRRAYDDAYAEAKAMKENGQTPEKIKLAVIREPEQPKPNQHGQVTMIFRKMYEAERRLSEIRRRAMDDALQGKPAKFKD